MPRSFKPLILGLAAISACAMTVHASPLLIYNPSPSVPVGFYWRAAGAPQLGDFVTVRAVRAAPLYARERGFTDRTDRFIKRLAAVSGQRVCANDNRVSIDRARVVHRLRADTMGHALPTWSGCRTLATDEVFLLGDTADSFDGRYWGPVQLKDIDGPWRPVRP
jgi:conjugative transfer signal peptidase TraF